MLMHKHLMTSAALVGSLATPALAQDDPRKDATDATNQANAALLEYLPFDDTTDFENANRGLIAPLPSDVIQTEDGALIWDPTKYGFVTEGSDAPATVNPSL